MHAHSNDGSGENSGHVRVYKIEDSQTSWKQLGQDIDGAVVNDNSGYSVSLSVDGKTLAIGSFGHNGNGDDLGHVRVFNID